MDTTKIPELVRDYLYLTPLVRKKDYQYRIKLASDVLTDSFNIESEEETTNNMDILYNEYLISVSKYISKYLDGFIKPYTCPGSGDSYRHFIIKYDKEPVIIKYTGTLEKENITEYVNKTLCYSIKINIEHYPKVVGSPTWHSY